MRAATFTTYINAQEDPGLAAAFDRQAKLAQSSYATITRAAEQASRATAGLLGGSGAGGTGINQVIQQRATATKSVVAAAADAERASARLAAASKREAAEIQNAARQQTAFAKSLTTTSIALNVVQGPLGPLAGRLSAISRAVTELSGARLGLAGFGATLFAFGRIANTYATIESRLRPFYDSQKAVNRAMDDVVGIATRARSSLEPVVDLYIRLTAAGKDLGFSQERASRLTELASKAATLSGGSNQSREAGLSQFAQALGSNQLGGDELRSIKENTFALAQAIAQGFKNADGSIGTTIGNLKKLGSEGKLTADVVADALERSSLRIETQYSRLPKTLSSAGTQLANSFTVLVGRFDQSIGLTSTLASALSLIADNLRVISALAVGIGGAFAGIKLVGLVRDIAGVASGFVKTELAAKALANQELATATASHAQHQREIVDLEAEQQQIRENIALLERKRQVAQTDFLRANLDTTPLGGKEAARKAAEAADEESKAVRGLIRERQQLGVINNALVGANSRAAASSNALGTATANVANRVGLLRRAGGSLVSFLGGPWGIAFAVATTALYLLATAESQAEKATRLHEDAQRSFAGIIDRTTGKIYDQVDALQKLAIQKKNSDDVAANEKAARGFQGQLVNALRAVSRPLGAGEEDRLRGLYSDPRSGRTPEQAINLARASAKPDSPERRALDAAITSFERGEAGSYTRLANTVNNLKDRIPGLRAALPNILSIAGSDPRSDPEGKGSGFLGSYSRFRQGTAASRVLRGQARPGDTALALGEEPYTTTGTGKGRTKSQIEADAAVDAAKGELALARAELNKIKKNGMLPGENEEQYQDRVAAAIRRVTAATDAQKASRAGASAQRAQDRKDARDAIQDAKDEAAAKRDAATEALLKTNPDTGSKAFLEARLKILQTYDDEINKIDASKAASTSATNQRLADLKKEEDAAPGRGEKRNDILANYDEAPKAIDQARDRIDDLQKMVDHLVDGVAFVGKTAAEIEAIKKINPLGRGIYTQEMADADAKRIEEGVKKPLRDMQRDFDRNVEIAYLQLQGRDAEAAALEKRNQLLDAGIDKDDIDLEKLAQNERQQLRINDALASRQRVVSTITGALDTARESTESLLVGLQTPGANVGNLFKTALKDFQQSFARINARKLTEQLFAGSDEKLRALLEGKSSVDTAISNFGTSVDNITTASNGAITAVDKLTTAFLECSDRIDGIQAGGNPLAAGDGATGAGKVAAGVAGLASQAFTGITSIVNTIAGGITGGSSGSSEGDIVVTGTRAKVRMPTSVVPSTRDIGGAIFGSLFSGADKLVDKIFGRKGVDASGEANGDIVVKKALDGQGNEIGGSSFFKGIGGAFSSALEGAGQGAIASGFAKALGIKQSSTGAAIGGAIGSFLPIPGGSIIGGLIGGTLGGLFQKPKYASASVSLNQYGEAVGNTGAGKGGAQIEAATGSAKNVAQGINAIAQQLGATITNLPNITIGSFDGKARVDLQGRTGSLDSKHAPGVLDFGKGGEQAAIEYAIRYSVSHAVINGISQASKNIIASGQDLDQAIQKAVAIESIPKRLLQLTNPVKYAVSTLNDEFTKLISYLKEGGATAEQFADAQKLYDLERADAIKQATQQAAEQIDQFLKDMVGGSNSPLNKRDTYENAAKDLNAFKSDIASGKVVDQNDLLSAARNFQDASRALNGSSQGFFDDFDMLRSLLEKARDNAGITDVTTLPASPFSTDSTVQAAIASLSGATNAQTVTLSDKLDQVIIAINGLGDVTGTGGGGGNNYSDYFGSIGMLPGFSDTIYGGKKAGF